MALGDYTGLKASIADHLNRSDLGNVVADFIDLAHAQIQRRLRVSEMLTQVTLTPADGVATLPADCLEVQKVTALNNPRRALEQISTDYADQYDPYRAGVQSSFYVVQGSTLRLVPSEGADVELVYYQSIPTLSDAAPTNWLLTKQPGIYLYGSLIFSGPYLHDDQRTGLWGKFFENELNALMAEDTAKRYGQINRIPAVVK